MAPEQARDTHEASVASDSVYLLGATLLFAATGHPPYQGATVMDVLARLATEEPDLSGLPDELTELISACMAPRAAAAAHLVGDAWSSSGTSPWPRPARTRSTRYLARTRRWP